MREGDGGVTRTVALIRRVLRVDEDRAGAYAASKGGLKLLTQGMCAEWTSASLQVNALAPGYIETELTQPLVEDREFSQWLLRRTPARRWGKTTDLVGALLCLVSPASDFANGHTLFVDGEIVAVI
jgi:gluconate 5-dehydrogenase